MTKFAYNLHRVFAGLILLLILLAGADYYLDLGFVGRRTSKGVLILCIVLMVVYGTFFSATRKDMQEYKEARKAVKETDRQ